MSVNEGGGMHSASCLAHDQLCCCYYYSWCYLFYPLGFHSSKVLLEENDPAAPMLPMLTFSGTHAHTHTHIHTPHPISSAALVSAPFY